MNDMVKASLFAGVAMLSVVAAAEATVFTVTAGGTISTGVDHGLFGASTDRDLSGLQCSTSISIDASLPGPPVGDASAFAVFGVAAAGAFVSLMVDGVTGFSGSDFFGGNVVGQLSPGGGFDGLFAEASGVGADGQRVLAV